MKNSYFCSTFLFLRKSHYILREQPRDKIYFRPYADVAEPDFDSEDDETIAISIAGIITTIITGARTVIKKGASATSKFAKALGKIAEKAGPVLGALFNLAAGLLKLGASAASFLSENLWILAVLITYALYDQAKTSKNK